MGYDPSVLSNQKVATMSNAAAKNASDYFVKNPTLRKTTVRVDGYLLEVTKDSKTSLMNNAYLTLPGR